MDTTHLTEVPASPLERVAKAAGNPSRLARQLSVTPQTVQQWLDGKRPVPPARCVQIERLGLGVNRADLRPDDWRDLWPELAAAA